MDKVNSHKSQLNMFNENREMMNFLDFKLRNFFENNGLYSWEINSCIINGSEPIRLSMTSKLKVDIDCMCDCTCY
jgi:hypothetical protein